MRQEQSSPERSSKIFVNYRREDSAGHAGRLFDRLSARFPARVFMDIDNLEPGVDFVEVIETAVGSCEVLIVVIGNEWLSVKDAAGRRRLDDPADYVRLEIATALQRQVRVIPVLVQRASMPRAEELPPDLVKLARRNAIELSDARWAYDVDRLIRTIEEVLQGLELRAPKAAAGSAVATFLAAEHREAAPPATVARAARWRAWIALPAAVVVAGIGWWMVARQQATNGAAAPPLSGSAAAVSAPSAPAPSAPVPAAPSRSTATRPAPVPTAPARSAASRPAPAPSPPAGAASTPSAPTPSLPARSALVPSPKAPDAAGSRGANGTDAAPVTVKKGMTWQLDGTNPTAGTIDIGCDNGNHPCDAYKGDTACTERLPILCIKKQGAGFPLPLPAGADNTDRYHRWSGGIVGTTEATMPPAARAAANALCVKKFGLSWRVAEFHDGWAWHFQASGSVDDLNGRFWVDINDQPNATCWQ
ncbi:MAG TPA: toll/interleukin-1 receptor domain-containing protein [Thermoanaerobaculia bacterium]